MALEINEIGIKVQVRDGTAPVQRKAAPEDGGCNDPDREQMIEDVVVRVLKALKKLKER